MLRIGLSSDQKAAIADMNAEILNEAPQSLSFTIDSF